MPFGCSFLQLAHKLLAVNDEAQVSAFAYYCVALHGFDGEIQLAAVYLCQRGFSFNLGTYGCRLQVRRLYVSAYGGASFGQFGGNGCHGGVLHQRHHCRRSQHGQVARTHCLGGESFGHRKAACVCKSCFQHNYYR